MGGAFGLEGSCLMVSLLGEPLPIAPLCPHLQENGQMAVSPSSVQGLLDVVRGWGCGPAQDPRLLPLALEALVGAVHVLHTSRTPSRGPELRGLLEGYFSVLNADWPAGPSPGPEKALVTLRVSMLGGYGLPPGEGVLAGEGPSAGKAELGCMGKKFQG